MTYYVYVFALHGLTLSVSAEPAAVNLKQLEAHVLPAPCLDVPGICWTCITCSVLCSKCAMTHETIDSTVGYAQYCTSDSGTRDSGLLCAVLH